MPIEEETLTQMVSEVQAGVRGYVYRRIGESTITLEEYQLIYEQVIPAVEVAAFTANTAGEFDRIPARLREKRVKALLLETALHHVEKLGDGSHAADDFAQSMGETLARDAIKPSMSVAAMKARAAARKTQMR